MTPRPPLALLLPALLFACSEEPEPATTESEAPGAGMAPVADPGKAADPLDAALDDAVAAAEQRTENYAADAPEGTGSNDD